MGSTLISKLAQYSEPKGDGCILWTGALSTSGYGNVRDGRRQLLAHRAAFEVAHGVIPKGMYVCHRCDIKRCINADHLFLGTAADNSADMKSKGRSPKSRQKLTAEQTLRIATDSGTRSSLAKEFGLHLRYVYQIRRDFKLGAKHG